MAHQNPAANPEIAFVNSNLANLQSVIASLREGIEVVILDAGSDGLGQIARALDGRSDLAAIHLVGHGASGVLQMGNTTLDTAYLMANGDVMASIGRSLAQGGDILLYGCETGRDAAGVQFLRSFADATGADLAASDDVTGGSAAGADWHLEQQAGQVEAASAVTDEAGAGYMHTLALSAGSVHTFSSNTWAFSSLAQDAAGNLFLAHKLSGSAISIKQWTGSDWSEITQLTTAITGDTYLSDDLSLQIMPDGDIGLLFRHAKNVTSGIDSLRGIKWGEYDRDGGTWSTTLVEQQSHPSGWRNFDNPSLAIASDGTLHSVFNYTNENNEYNLKYSTSSDGGATWQTSTVLTTSIAGIDEIHQPSVYVDQVGDVHLLYVREDGQNDYYGNLYYASKPAGSGAWSAHERIVDHLETAFAASVGGDGAAYVGYATKSLDAEGYVIGSTLHVLSNEGGAWSNDAGVLTDAYDSYITGVQVAGGKPYLLVNSTTADYEQQTYVMRRDGDTWVKGFDGEQQMPGLSFQNEDYFEETAFAVSPSGVITVVIEHGELKEVDYVRGTSDDFGLTSNAAPTIGGVHGDAGQFSAGTVDPVADNAFIDVQDASHNAVLIADADSADFDGGKLVITQGTGTGNGNFSLDLFNAAAGAAANNLDGALVANEKVFVDPTGSAWIEIGQVHATQDGRNGNPLTIVFNSAATPDMIDFLVKGMLFTAPTAGTRNFSMTVSDGDGGTSAPSTFSMTGADVDAPFVTGITSSSVNGLKKVGDTISIELQFSEPVTVTGQPALTLETGATDRAAVYASGSGTGTLTFVYTVQAGDSTADLDVLGTNALALVGGTLKDGAGNDAVLTIAAPGAAGSLGANKAFAVDGHAPTDIALSNASILTASAPGATVGNFSTTDGAASDGFTYTLVAGTGDTDNGAFGITGNALTATNPGTLGDGVRSVRVRTSDLAGNSYDEVFQVTLSSGPTVAVSTSTASVKAGETAIITFTFSDMPVGFDATDVTVSGGTLGALTVDAGDSKVYTAVFTPAADTQNVSGAVSVGAGRFANAGGTDNAGSSTNAAITGDTLSPTVAITSTRTSFKAGDTATVTFTFSETPAAFGAEDISVTGGTLSGLAVSGDSRVHTALFTPDAGAGSLSGAISINGARFSDMAGNGNAASTTNVAIGGDTVLPVVGDANLSIAGASGSGGAYRVGDTVTVSWNDGAQGDNNGDIAAAQVDFSQFGGPAAAPATQSAGLWSASFTIVAGALDASNRNVAISVTDHAGNEGTLADTTSVRVDSMAPVVTDAMLSISGATGIDGVFRIGDTVTAAWNDTVGGNANADTAAATFDFSQFGGGAVAAANAGGAWSASYLIAAAAIDAVDRNVSVTVADDAGNLTTRADSSNADVDAAAPAISSITVAGAPAGNATEVDFTVVFAEAVTGLALSDFTLAATGAASGTIASVSGAGTTYTVKVTGIAGNGSLKLNLSGAASDLADDAGNGVAGAYAGGAAHSVGVATAPPAPTAPPSVSTVDGVNVETGTMTNSDGSTSQSVTVPVVTADRSEVVGNNTVADIPLVKSANGTSLLSVQVPTGFGLAARGMGEAKAAGDSLTDLIREIKAHTAAGSSDQDQLTGGGSGFLSGLPADTQLLVQTIVPTMAAGAAASATPLVIAGNAQAGTPMTALVIDTRGLPQGSEIQLQNIEFAAVIGSVKVTGGAGSQRVWGDGGEQYIVLGADDDILHGGAGDDTIGSAGGNDQIFGDEGNDVVFGGEGNDLVDGGTGIDTISLAGASRAEYMLRVIEGKFVMAHRNGGIDGVDTVSNVEMLRFANASADTSATGSLTRLYEALFDRAPDPAGLQAWRAAVDGGATLEQVARAMLGTAEGQQHAAAGNAEFVSVVYRNLFGRDAAAQDQAGWTRSLEDASASKAGLALTLADSAAKLAASTAADVSFGSTDAGTLVRLYDALFDRKADAGGVNFWLERSEAGMGMADIADGFVKSAESSGLFGSGSDDAFVHALYDSALHRSASDAEAGYWTGLLGSGRIDRGDLLLAIADSAEKVALVGVISTSFDTI